MTVTILTLAFAYAVILAIIVGIFVAGRVRPVWRVGAALLAAGLFVLTYYQVGELRGLPSDSSLPPFFKLHWARVVEPNQMQDEPGRIFLWIEALDEDNYPSGLPRAYVVPYSEDLVRKVDGALADIQDGKEVAGALTEQGEAEDTATRLAEDVAGRSTSGADAGTVGERVVLMDFGNMSFVPMPAPVTPEKPG